MRDEIFKRIEELFLIDDVLINECKDVDDTCLADLDLRLAHLPLNGRNQHLLQQLLAYRSHCLMQISQSYEVLNEDKGVHTYF